MPKTKKLDIFNLFYSGAAVVILIGVIAKLLEWPLQDLLITGGLAIEAVVFGVSAIKFVEVKKDTEVATEATLSKVADGLEGIASGAKMNASSLGIGNGSGTDAYINIQTGNGEYSNAQSLNNGEKNISIDINNPNLTANSGSHSLWQLEQMDILSIAKDLFFQPTWDRLSSEEYTRLSLLFKRIFDKKLPNKEALPFLLQFPIKLPVPELNQLVLEKPHSIDLNDIELLCNAFSMINFNSFFENLIIEGESDSLQIRPKSQGEIQIFGGEDEAVISHVNNYYNKKLIVCPNIEFLESSIKLKGQSLLEYLIQKIDIKNENELNSLVSLIQPYSDELKKKLWTKFKKIKFNYETSDGYSYLKLLVQSAISFSNIYSGAQLIKELLEITINENKTIGLEDVVNYNAEIIYFGQKNEYSVNLNELFVNGELENLGFIHLIIEKLVADNVAAKYSLLQVFNLNEQESKKEVFDKLNYHLTKTNTSPSGAQLAFVLLYKQYQNS